MATLSKPTLELAIAAMESAFAHLEAATDVALHERAQSAAQRESVQAEITQTWEQHSNKLEADLAEAQSENEFLKDDNLRLSNQLQQLQQEYLELQNITGSAVGQLDASVKQLDLILEH